MKFKIGDNSYQLLKAFTHPTSSLPLSPAHSRYKIPVSTSSKISFAGSYTVSFLSRLISLKADIIEPAALRSGLSSLRPLLRTL